MITTPALAERRLAGMLAKHDNWLPRITDALAKPPSMRTIKRALRLWIAMSAEFGVDWHAVNRAVAEDELPVLMDRIMAKARRDRNEVAS